MDVPLYPISTLNEKPLHAALKRWYAQPDDELEVSVDGFVVDIVRGDLLVEIQTGSFASIRRKLVGLTAHHSVRLVYPIAQEKWIVKLPEDEGDRPHRRKSPKRGTLVHVFEELVSFPALLSKPKFSLEVLLIKEEEIRRRDGTRGWRRKGWVIQERRLLDVVGQRLFRTPADMEVLMSSVGIKPFTTAEMAAAIDKPRWLAQKMAYCLREMGAIKAVGKQGNAVLYVRAMT